MSLSEKIIGLMLFASLLLVVFFAILKQGESNNSYIDDALDSYTKRTRPDLYSELQVCGSHWAEAEIFMRDTGLTILGTDGIVDTRQKLLDYYITKDVNEPNK